MRRFHLPMIAAIDRNGCIGRGPAVPWHLYDDTLHFENTTTGEDFIKTGRKKSLVIGRKTFDSLDPSFKPLKNRINLILTRDTSFKAAFKDCRIIRDVNVILNSSRLIEVFVVGGAEIYKLFLPYTDRMLITHVDTVVEDGDVFFPEISNGWKTKVLAEFKKTKDRNDFDFSILEYTRPPRY
jgi:dihydrofolate reductase